MHIAYIVYVVVVEVFIYFWQFLEHKKVTVSNRGAESRTWARGQLNYDGFQVL